MVIMFLLSATPQTDYYIIAGVVYQAPDLCTVINSRLVSDGGYEERGFRACADYGDSGQSAHLQVQSDQLLSCLHQQQSSR